MSAGLTAVACAAAGAILGLRFIKATAILPATIGAVTIAVAAGVAHGLGGWSVLAECAAATVGIQVGYLGGAAARFAGREVIAGRDGKTAAAARPESLAR